MNNQIKIGVVGMWHLGCIISVSWAKSGFDVIGFDYDKKIISSLHLNNPPLFEPHLSDRICDYQGKGKLKFVDDMRSLHECDFVFLAIDTPVKENDECDLEPLQRAINDLGDVLKNRAIVVVSSQTPVWTCRKFRNHLKKKNDSLELVYSPENLRLGQAIECYLNPGRVILGGESPEAIKKSVALFEKICPQIIVMNLASAEMTKHAINAFLATSVTFANHLSDLCEVVNANVIDVIRGVKSDDRIGAKAYLAPGIGFSGGTLARDLTVLAELNQSSGKQALLYQDILKFNYSRKYEICDQVVSLLGGNLAEKTIAVLGITYKPGTSTLRRSLPLEITKLLAQKNIDIRVYDPKADYQETGEKFSFVICSSVDEAVTGADVVLLMTEWDEFKTYDWVKASRLVRQKIIFDTKNFLNGSNLRAQGYQYKGLGL